MGSWYWIYGLLVWKGFAVVFPHPLKTKAIASAVYPIDRSHLLLFIFVHQTDSQSGTQHSTVRPSFWKATAVVPPAHCPCDVLSDRPFIPFGPLCACITAQPICFSAFRPPECLTSLACKRKFNSTRNTCPPNVPHQQRRAWPVTVNPIVTPAPAGCCMRKLCGFRHTQVLHTLRGTYRSEGPLPFSSRWDLL